MICWRGFAVVGVAALVGLPGARAASVRDLREEVRTINLDHSIRPINLDHSIRGLTAQVVDTVVVVKMSREVRVEISADVLFDFDKATIKDEARSALGEAAVALRAYPGTRVRIEGHADGKGNEAHNRPLSQRRAEAVKTWLVSREQVALMGSTVAGFGAQRPIAPNTKPDGSDDPDGRRLNRRVEIIISQ